MTPWTVALQALLFMGFPSKNLGVGCYFLLQEIFLTQGSNRCLLCLLHWQVNFLPLRHLEMEAKYLLPHLSGGTTGTCPLHSQTPSRFEPSWPWYWPAPVWLLLSSLSLPYQCFLDHLTSRHLALQTLSQGGKNLSLEKLSLTYAGPSRTQAHGPLGLIALHGILRRSPQVGICAAPGVF